MAVRAGSSKKTGSTTPSQLKSQLKMGDGSRWER